MSQYFCDQVLQQRHGSLASPIVMCDHDRTLESLRPGNSFQIIKTHPSHRKIKFLESSFGVPGWQQHSSSADDGWIKKGVCEGTVSRALPSPAGCIQPQGSVLFGLGLLMFCDNQFRMFYKQLA